ncbi:MAG: hypothetical protein B6229_02950 [Spirochaetaceae bacterium 4572_7]|nr:MAG: hypothetical protein B6229_02950 [Spirochaetaceae bacterium 4572_7]
MIYKKNIELLKTRGINLDNNKTDPTFIIEKSKSGDLTLKIDGLYIHSKHNPIREAEKIAKQQQKCDLIFIGGFGLGYVVEAINREFPDTKIIIYEPSVDFFNEALKQRDFSEIINSNNIEFLIGHLPESIKYFFQPQFIKTITYIPLLNRVKVDNALFTAVKNSIYLYLDRVEINKNTLRKFGSLWVKNQCKNLPMMGYSNDISDIFGKFSDIPGIIVSAGPSMELIIPHLKRLKESFLILAVDTAFKSLLESGIEPDFVMSIDSQYWNSRHLESVKCEKSILIADSSIQPSAIRSFSNRVYFTKSSFPLGEYFEKERPPLPKIASGGSVSTNIWDFAQKLGLSKIYFIGQDLGYPGGITHYKESYFEKNMLTLSNRFHPLESHSFNYIYNGYPTYVESNSGNRIISDKRMTVYINWFKERIKVLNINNCFNLSPHGCKIPGMDLIEINTILNMPQKRESIENIISLLENRDNNLYLPKMLNAAYNFRNNLNNITEISKKALNLGTLIENMHYKNMDTRQDLIRLDNFDKKLILSNHSQTLSFIIEPFIQQLTKLDNLTPLEALKASILLYEKLLSTGKLHLKYLNHSISTIESINMM